jgi:H+-transporting ATPase
MAHNYAAIRGTLEAAVDDYACRGVRCIAVARTDEQGRWCFMGLLTFLDPPRPDTRQTIEAAHGLGVGVKMVTGDQVAIAKETCRVLGMGTAVYGTADLPEATEPDAPGAELVEIADGFAGVYPEHKFNIVETLRRRGWTVGMTGDGVNDAPALKKADVGIAVEGATDAACAAADIVLTEPGLSTIIVAIELSRCIFQRLKNYLTYRVASSLTLALFFVVSASAFNPQAYLGCVATNGTLPADVAGQVCQLELPGEGVQGASIVVDMHGVAIPNFFLLNILQVECEK